MCYVFHFLANIIERKIRGQHLENVGTELAFLSYYCGLLELIWKYYRLRTGWVQDSFGKRPSNMWQMWGLRKTQDVNSC